MAKKITLPFIKKEVHRLDPQLKETDDYFKTAVIMLAALQVGTSIRALAAFTGFPKVFIKRRTEALRVNGIFKGGKIFAEWFDDETGSVAFWMDVAVAEGLLARSDKAA